MRLMNSFGLFVVSKMNKCLRMMESIIITKRGNVVKFWRLWSGSVGVQDEQMLEDDGEHHHYQEGECSQVLEVVEWICRCPPAHNLGWWVEAGSWSHEAPGCSCTPLVGV